MKIVLALMSAVLGAGACILADVSARREIEFGPRDDVAEYTGLGSVGAWLVMCFCLAAIVSI